MNDTMSDSFVADGNVALAFGLTIGAGLCTTIGFVC